MCRRQRRGGSVGFRGEPTPSPALHERGTRPRLGNVGIGRVKAVEDTEGDLASELRVEVHGGVVLAGGNCGLFLSRYPKTYTPL